MTGPSPTTYAAVKPRPPTRTGAAPPTGTTTRGSTTYGYDDAGQLTSTTDARAVTLSYAYDSLGRKTSTWQGAVTTGTKRAEWAYDTLAKGQLTSATRIDAGNTYTTAVTSYDDGYRPLGVSVAFPPVEGALSTQGPWVSTTTYNVDGSVAAQTLPSGGGLPAETITTGYDSSGYVVSSAGLDTYLASISYYPWGPAYQSLHGPAGKQVRLTTTLDEATARLTSSQVHTENQTSPGTFDEARTDEYSHSNAGGVTAIPHKQAGAVVSAQCFGYDRLQRLVDAYTNTSGVCGTPATPTAGPNPYRTAWSYDPVGNRTGQTRFGLGGAADAVTTYAYPPAGGVRPHAVSSATTTGPGAGTDSYGYDAVGDTTTRDVAGTSQTLTWDPEAHVATHTVDGQTTSYLYNAGGARLLRRDPDGTTTAYLDAQELKKNPAGVVAGTRYYGATASRTQSGLTWLASDHHGTRRSPSTPPPSPPPPARACRSARTAAPHPPGSTTRASSAAPPIPPD